MMHSSSSKVIHQNHDAVASLLKGDYERSIACSWKALGMIQTIIMDPSPTPIQQVRGEGDADANATFVAERQTAAIIRSIPLLPLPVSLRVDEGAVALYNRALVLDAPMKTERRSADDEDLILAAVLLYNTGLCHHVQGLQNPTQSTRLLRTTLKMYTMASSILYSAFPTEGHDDDDNSKSIKEANALLLQLALLNNMAHVYAYFMNVGNAWHCVDTMNDAFEALSMMAEEEEEEENSIVTSDDFVFFSLACNLFTEDSFARAPAA